jgi:hypothetical protein
MMININKIKFLVIAILGIISLCLLIIYFQTIITKPVFEKIDPLKIPSVDINVETALKPNQVQSNTEIKTNFDYKIIGFIAGKNDSSVIVKKGNKEHVVVLGSRLDGKYELISVSRDEIVFKADSNIYKIKNMVGK